VPLTVLVALLVCLIPTTIGGLLSAIGIAGMDRLIQANVIATSGRAVEAAGDVDVLLLDKTGTITLGNRQATEPSCRAGGVRGRVGRARRGWRRSWPTRPPRGAASWRWPWSCTAASQRADEAQGASFMPFTAQTRMSGVDLAGRSIPQGRDRRHRALRRRAGRFVPEAECAPLVDDVAKQGATPLVVADGARVLGVVHSRTSSKAGIRERFAELRRIGHPHRDDHGRQPADRGGHRRRGRASTTSWPRPPPRPSWPDPRATRPRGTWWP
jgi:K+-transporting ATPase ATPase B chain